MFIGMAFLDACKTVRMAGRRPAPLILSALASALAWIAPSRPGLADDRGAVARLVVTRAPEAIDCPDASTLASAVASIEAWAAVQTGAGPRAPMLFDVEFAKDQTRYTAEIRVSGSHGGVRRMTDDSPTCSNLASGVATHLALLVDEVDAEPKPSPSKAQSAPAMDHDDSVSPHTSEVARAPQDVDNDLFLEILGNGPLLSVNYERFFLPDRILGVRAGVGFFPALEVCVGLIGCPRTAASAVFPLLANGYVGGGSSPHRLQLGAGISFFTKGLFHGEPSCPGFLPTSAGFSPCSNPAELAGPEVVLTAVVGYRYFPREGGFTFGFGLTPLLYLSRGAGLIPLAGASAGVGF